MLQALTPLPLAPYPSVSLHCPLPEGTPRQSTGPLPFLITSNLQVARSCRRTKQDQELASQFPAERMEKCMKFRHIPDKNSGAESRAGG